MKVLRKLNNFNSFLALVSALDSPPVRRLGWPKNIEEQVREHCALIDSSCSFRAYRQALAETHPPCIPYMWVWSQHKNARQTFCRVIDSPLFLLVDAWLHWSKIKMDTYRQTGWIFCIKNGFLPRIGYLLLYRYLPSFYPWLWYQNFGSG